MIWSAGFAVGWIWRPALRTATGGACFRDRRAGARPPREHRRRCGTLL